MKPYFIFAPVALICMLMLAVLPGLAAAPEVQTAAPEIQATLPPAPTEAPAGGDGAVADPPAEEAVVQEVTEPPAPEPAPPEQDAPVQEPAALVLDSQQSPAAEPRPAVDQSLEDFVASVANNQAGVVVGVYVPGQFAFPVVDQPAGDDNFVSSEPNMLTRYVRPGLNGVFAFLAHNYLSGSAFFQLQKGQEVILVYGDGSKARFQVSDIQHYQALSPHDVRSDFRDLNRPDGEILSYSQLYSRVYTLANHVVFQTCVEANGDPSWGRIFVVAEPAG